MKTLNLSLKRSSSVLNTRRTIYKRTVVATENKHATHNLSLRIKSLIFFPRENTIFVRKLNACRLFHMLKTSASGQNFHNGR